MSDLLSPTEMRELRALQDGLLPHRYTRIRRSAGARDSENSVSTVEGYPEPNIACRYRSDNQLNVDADGVETIQTPVVHIGWSDPLTDGDLMQDIASADGTLLVAGPLEVETVTPIVSYGGVLRQRVTLRGTTPERAV